MNIMIVVKFPNITEPGTNMCVADYPTIIDIVPNSSEPNPLSPNGDSVYSTGYKAYFTSPEEILNDINMKHMFHISEECKKSVNNLSKTDTTFESAYKIMEYLDNTSGGFDEDEAYYMLINTNKTDVGGVWSTYNGNRYPTFVYAITSSYAEIQKKINTINYDNVMAYLMNSDKMHTNILPTINHSASSAITINDVNDAATDKNNPKESFDIYKFMSRIVLRSAIDMRLYTHSDLMNIMYGISNSMSILKMDKKTAELSRYKNAFIFTPLDDTKTVCYIPPDIANAFILTSTINRYMPVNPIINKTLYPSYSVSSASSFIPPAPLIDDNNVAKSYMNPKPLNEEYPNLFKSWGYKTHPLQNLSTIPIENDPEENVDDDFSSNIEDNDMGD